MNGNPRDPVGAMLHGLLFTGRQSPGAVSLRTPGKWLLSMFHGAASDVEAWWFRTTKCRDCSAIEWRWHSGPHDR